MTTDFQTRTLQDVVGALRAADGNCVVLTGAGCSKSAGIPLASELVREIEKNYPEPYARAKKQLTDGVRPSYNQLMEQLSQLERRNLLNPHIENAKINWAHLALAQLFKHKKINRVLTVNFDPLLLRACAMVGFFPAIYDFANLEKFKPHRIATNSIFYLNGQHTGFVVLNGAEELIAHKIKLKSIVSETATNRVWLVVGYSGEADALLKILAEQPDFDGDLYWLGHSTQPSVQLVESGLFEKGKCAFYVGGQDADACLTALAQDLGFFPPDFLTRPHGHLIDLLETIAPETGGPVAAEFCDQLIKDLTNKNRKSGSNESLDTPEVEKWLLSNEPQKVIDWFNALPKNSQKNKALNLVAWAWIEQGNAIHEQAQENQNLLDAEIHWKQAYEKFAQALQIKPDMHAAVNNWGNALGAQAQAVKGKNLQAAKVLWQQAGEKYALALQIKPDKHEAAYNWGNALDDQACAVQDEDPQAAKVLWQQAGEKYALALQIKPEMHEAANNWGSALNVQARAVQDEDPQTAKVLWQQAGEKYALALQIKPNMHEAAFNLACVYGLQGNVSAALAQLETCRQMGKLEAAAHWRTAPALAAVRATPEYAAWMAQHNLAA